MTSSNEPPADVSVVPEFPPIPFATLFRDHALIVVSKPPGVLVHRTALSRARESFMLQSVAAHVGHHVHAVHRLDRNTSGILIFALDPDAARAAQASLQSPSASKEYLVLARGIAPEVWTMDRPLRSESGEPRPARTHATRMAAIPDERCSLLRVTIDTGRRHQIRRHLNHAAHHVVGDTTHGKGKVNAHFRAVYGLPRMFLHAWRVQFEHPVDGRTITIADPLAEDLDAVLARLPGVPPGVLDTVRPTLHVEPAGGAGGADGADGATGRD
ncbi:MAG: pseudouridine synthase [Phycisphaerales bacterium]